MFRHHAADLLDVRFRNGEQPGVEAELFPRLGNMPRLKAEVTADSVPFCGFQMNAQVFHIFQVSPPRQFVAPVGQLADLLLAGGVVLVLDIADNLLQNVFNGGQT